MKVERTFDYDLIMSVVGMPEFDVCLEDGLTANNYQPDKTSAWLLVTDNNDIISLTRLKPLNSIVLEVHPRVLAKHRSKYNKLAVLEMYKWVLEFASQYKKINAEIPVIYPHLKRFMYSIGFSLEGVNRKSHIKNGEIVDKWVFGITQEELKEVLQ
tara:strand:+ start:72 stop:539 length:468 start_codon:yes stop_codon:yes gene_type:complete